MNKAHKLLGGLLLAQVALILLVRSPFSGASTGSELRPLLPALEAVTPSRMVLEGADDASVTLTRQEEDWVLEDLDGFPVDGTKVADLLDKLRGLQIRTAVVSGSRYHGSFKVAEDEFEGRVRIWDDPASEPTVDLILGTSPNYRLMNVRRADETPVYEVRDLATYDVRAEPGSWAVKGLVDVEEDDVVSIEIVNAAGSFRLEKVDGGWTVAAPTAQASAVLDDGKVDSLVRSAASLRLADPLGSSESHGPSAGDAVATVTLHWSRPAVEAAESATDDEAAAVAPPAPAESGQVVVYIGDKLPDKDTHRAITREGFGFSGTIWDSSVSSLVEKTLDELLPDEEDEDDEETSS